jgi:hypothetical protein
MVDKLKQKFLQWCNLTFNDKKLKILRTHVINISRIQISYLRKLYRSLQIFHNVYIRKKHKIHVVQINNKKKSKKY